MRLDWSQEVAGEAEGLPPILRVLRALELLLRPLAVAVGRIELEALVVVNVPFCVPPQSVKTTEPLAALLVALPVIVTEEVVILLSKFVAERLIAPVDGLTVPEVETVDAGVSSLNTPVAWPLL